MVVAGGMLLLSHGCKEDVCMTLLAFVLLYRGYLGLADSQL